MVEKLCRACGENKKESDFGVNVYYKNKRSPRCKKCVREKRKIKDSLKKNKVKRKFVQNNLLKCSKCKELKDKLEFHKDSSCYLGYSYNCKSCVSKNRDILRLKNFEKELKKKIHSLENEIWKDVPGYDGHYKVSNMGRLMSMPRISKYKTRGCVLVKKKLISTKASTLGYVTVVLRKDGESKAHRLHRLVMLAFKGFSDLLVDHINGIKDDNRLENLRYCTARQNVHFSKIDKEGSSKYIGVSYLEKGDRWVATIHIGKKSYTVGIFDTEIKAHKAYRKALNNWENFQKLPDYKVRVPTSKCKGVGYHKRNNQWEAQIKINKKYYNLGSYTSEEDACKARKEAEENYNEKGVLPHYVNPKLTSKYKYVTKNKEKWQAQSPKINGKSEYIGLYESEIEAALAVKQYLGLDKLLER